MSSIIVKGFGMSDIGRKREINEDSILVDNDLGLYGVCDGLGGHNAGEIASGTALRITQQIIKERKTIFEELRIFGVPDSNIIRYIEDLVCEVAKEINRLAGSKDEYYKMGTTLTILLILDNRAVMGHVGDSRLYMVRNEQAFQLSDDHTYANEMMRAGLLDPDKAQHSKYRHTLTQSVGTEEVVIVDTLLFDLLPEDLLILCSDGLSNYIEENNDLEELTDPSSPENTVKQLINWANAKGGEDNISVVAVAVDQDRIPTSEEKKRHSEITINVQALKQMPLFEDLPLRDLLRIVNIAEIEDLAEGELIMEQGKECLDYCLVLDGSVLLQRAGCEEYAVKAGEAFGLESFISCFPSLSTARTREDSRLLMIAAKEMDILMHRRPRLGQRIYRHLSYELAVMLDAYWT